MNMREKLIQEFLQDDPWSRMQRHHLAGDASNRKYERLIDPNTSESYVLMDSPGDPKAAIEPFVALTEFLADAGLSPPKILKKDISNGLMIIEDLGNDIFAEYIRNNPDETETLYQSAVDVLLHLHQQTPPKDILAYGPKEMGFQTAQRQRTWAYWIIKTGDLAMLPMIWSHFWKTHAGM